MTRLRAAALALALFPAAGAFAGGFTRLMDMHAPTAEETAMKSAGGEAAVVLDWLRYDDDVDATSAEYVRIKVFTQDGKKYGDVEVPYLAAYPFFGRVTDINARTIHPDGTVVPFDGKVYDKVIYKSGGETLRAKAFSLSDVQPGSILEYRCMRRWSDTVLTASFWTLQRDIPILHAKMTLHPYSKGEYSSFFTYFGLPEGKAPVKTGDHFDIEVDHIPAFQHEEFSPPEEQLKPHVAFYYTSSRIRPDEYWGVHAKDLNKETEKFVGKAGTAQDEARKAAAGSKTPDETLHKIYARAQSLRNLSFGAADEKAKPSHNVAEVLTAGAGFRDEINRAFVAMARAGGFDADVVRVAPRNHQFFSDKVPDPDQMSAEVSLVIAEGKPIFLDPGTPGAPFGTISWEKSGVTAIHLTKGGAPEFTKTPDDEPATAVTQRKADLHLEGDVLKGVVTVTFSGQEALVRRLRGEDDSTRKKALEEEAKRWFSNGSIVKLTNVTGLNASDDSIVASFDVELQNAASQAGSRTLVPLSIFAASSKNPFAPSTRKNSVYFEYARREVDEIKLAVPPPMIVVSLPQPSDLDAGSFKYKSQSQRNAADVTFTRTMEVNAMFIEPQYYSGLRGFYAAVATADQRPVVVKQQEAQ
jgi:hypothetical protein